MPTRHVSAQIDNLPELRCWFEVDAVEAFAGDVVQRHRQYLGVAVDPANTIEPEAIRRRTVLLHAGGDAEELGFRAGRSISLDRTSRR